MTICADHEIRLLCLNGMVEPFDPDLLNPASLDVRLGPNLMVEVGHASELMLLSIEGHTEAAPYWMQPGEFLLGETAETFNLPLTVAAEFRLKSSRAREGMDQALAVWCDPGWHGSKLTVELRNNRRLHSLPLWPGMKIGQMVFHRMSAQPEQSYADVGRYNLDATVQASRGHR
jgi:dCTP deaminase